MHLTVAAQVKFGNYEQIGKTIVRMRNIDCNFKAPEPEAEQLTADSVVAHIMAKGTSHGPEQCSKWTYKDKERTNKSD